MIVAFRQKNGSFKKFEEDPGHSESCELFWPLLMEVPIAGSPPPSPNVAETLRKSPRVSGLVGAVVTVPAGCCCASASADDRPQPGHHIHA
jgi:hypothetical protein